MAVIRLKMAPADDEGLPVSWKRTLGDATHRSGAVHLPALWYGRRRLTVLAYHRVIDHAGAGFTTYRRNVSATPEQFERQMQAVAARFDPVSLGDVASWIGGGPRLPARAVLVTFDDGYRDNLDHALPILEEHGIPMTVFLATAHIGTTTPFGWDLAAWCFAHTERTAADLPFAGRRRWDDREERERVLGAWLESLKLRSEADRADAVAALAEILEVAPPDDAFDGVNLTWDDVRRMHQRGVAFGAHTRAHPILTRVGPDRAAEEIAGSKARVERELGVPAVGFAYPNGGPDDVDDTVLHLVREAGFAVAFTLRPGPARESEVLREPLLVRRIYVHHRDRPARFAANVAGWARLAEVLR